MASEEAIELASSSIFRQAREGWGGEIDFVGQIEYQLSFRPQFDFLDREQSFIAEVMDERPENAGIQDFGLYMSDDEVLELQRRMALGDMIPALRLAVSGIDETRFAEDVEPDFGPNYGGIWGDQLDGGAIVVALVDASLVDRAELEAIVGGAENLRILDGQEQWDVINSYRDDLYAAFAAAAITADVMIDSLGSGRRLTVRTPDLGAVTDEIRSAVPEDVVVFEEGPVATTTLNPLDEHSFSNQQPGLAIRSFPGAGCTWGANGHTNSYTYIITAGHCGTATYENFTPAWTTAYNIGQTRQTPTPKNLTVGSRYLYSKFTGDWDIKRMSSSYANDNCYHWGHCGKFIKNRAKQNSYDVNVDISCASFGSQNVYLCGVIREMDDPAGPNGGDRWNRVEIETIPGDSGSGMISNSGTGVTIDGILVLGNAPNYSWYQTAYDAQNQLGFQFNCANSVKTQGASSWSNCPAINR